MCARLISVAGGMLTAAGIALSAGPGFATGTDNCSVRADSTQKGAAISEKLRKCNGVLKPSKSADRDIVIPAPVIDDPLAIHPKDVPGGQVVPK